jgi:hypothetical protein
MPMKISLALEPRRPLSRQTAWGCLTTNIAMPGFGSLMAGRVSGYGQAALAVGGMIVTVVFGARFVFWYFANWSRFHGLDADPADALGEMWQYVKWPLLGFGMFGIGWLWALATSLQIVNSARKTESAAVPPRLR